MKKMMIGSAALREAFPDSRVPKDIDFFFDSGEWWTELVDGRRHEYIPAPAWWDYSTPTADPRTLLNIKASHLFWTRPQNRKHFTDIRLLLKKGHAVDEDLFHGLFAHWTAVRGVPKAPDFKATPNVFFNDRVKRSIPHDDLHALVCPSALYKKILVGDGTVNVSEAKFNALPFEERLGVVREELDVLTIERWSEKNGPPMLLRTRMLDHFIESLCPAWMALFCLKNYFDLYQLPGDYNGYIRELSQRTASPMAHRTATEQESGPNELLDRLNSIKIDHDAMLEDNDEEDSVLKAHFTPADMGIPEELGPCSVVDTLIGEEDGDKVHVVLYFERFDAYARLGGYWASFVGTVFDDRFTLVERKEKTVVYYE